MVYQELTGIKSVEAKRYICRVRDGVRANGRRLAEVCSAKLSALVRLEGINREIAVLGNDSLGVDKV